MKVWELYVNIFDRVSSVILSTNYTQQELRLLAVTCYLAATKFEGIPEDAYFFSAEVAADVVKLGLTTLDVKTMECKVMNALGWDLEVVCPSESAIYLLQAQKLLIWDGTSPINLNVTSWVKEAIRELIKASLEAHSDTADFAFHGFRAALACLMLAGKSSELKLIKDVFTHFLNNDELGKIQSEAEILCRNLLNRAVAESKQNAQVSSSLVKSEGKSDAAAHQKVHPEEDHCAPSDPHNDSFECSTSCCTASPSASKRPPKQAKKSSSHKKKRTSSCSPGGLRSECKIRPLSYRLKQTPISEDAFDILSEICVPQRRTTRCLTM